VVEEKDKNLLSRTSREDLTFESGSVSANRRIIRKVSPLGMRVLVDVCPKESVTDGGLYLPEGAKDKMSESVLAEVLEVASVIDEDTAEEANISGIPNGAKVLILKDAGSKIPWNESLRIVDTKDVLAIVDEVRLT